MAIDTLTFVTAFIKVNDIEYDDDRVSFEKRLDFFMKIVELNVNICLFISPEFKEIFEEIANKYKNMIIVEVLSVKELEITKIANKNANLLNQPEFRNHKKDVPNYMFIIHSKIEFIKKSIDINPFNSEFFCWVDFSLLYVVKHIEKGLANIKKYSESKFISTPFIAMPGCWNFKVGTIDKLKNNVCWRFCGGFFIGDKKSLQSFYHSSISHYEEFLKLTKTNVWEVNYWAWLESAGHITPIWYKADHNDTILDIPDEIMNCLSNASSCEESIFPISFCVPDECVVSSIPEKTSLLASLIPGDMSTYIFDKYKEKEYNEMYQRSRFAITKIKGGWDCLRHYEILMNGCIPLFENLNKCPTNTLTTYPKHLNDAAYVLFNTWIENEDCIQKYNKLCNEMIEHTRSHCTTSATAKYFLSRLKNGSKMKNILLITCQHGVNYTRETLWIGLKRHLKSIGGIGVEYDKMPFLYDDFDKLSSHKYYTSNCFTFPKRLEKDEEYNMNENEIIEKIHSNFWDLIIYGKVGPDEGCTFPFYDIVKTKYDKNSVVFIFGGDETFDLTYSDDSDTHINTFNRNIYYYPYKKYLNYYKDFGTCFVRELNK